MSSAGWQRALGSHCVPHGTLAEVVLSRLLTCRIAILGVLPNACLERKAGGCSPWSLSDAKICAQSNKNLGQPGG